MQNYVTVLHFQLYHVESRWLCPCLCWSCKQVLIIIITAPSLEHPRPRLQNHRCSIVLGRSFFVRLQSSASWPTEVFMGCPHPSHSQLSPICQGLFWIEKSGLSFAPGIVNASWFEIKWGPFFFWADCLLCQNSSMMGMMVKVDTNARSIMNSIVTLEHDAWPGRDVKKSFLHLEHNNDPAFEEIVPSAQGVQLLVLVLELYVPAGQLKTSK